MTSMNLSADDGAPDDSVHSGHVRPRTRIDAASTERRVSPLVLGAPLLALASVAFGLSLINYASINSAIPILVVAGAGLIAAAAWSFTSGEAAAGGIYAIFSGYWLSYCALLIGIIYHWYGIAPAQEPAAVELFLVSWLAVTILAIAASLDLPLVITLQVLVFGVSQGLLLVGSLTGNQVYFPAAGIGFFLLALLVGYGFIASIAAHSARRWLPVGPTIMSKL
jgi:succinate-acetate transporter protein